MPSAKTLKQKFGNLPIRYMRVNLKDEDDWQILETVVRRYKFNLVSEDPTTTTITNNSFSKIRYPSPILIENSEDVDDDEDDQPKKKKTKKN
mgnify:CR=1 FL=1